MSRPISMKFIEHASDIASYYGFRPLRHINPELYRKEIGRAPLSFSNTAAMCVQAGSGKEYPAVLAYYSTPTSSHTPPDIVAREAGEFSLQVIGCPQSMGEIVILKTLTAILSDWGTPIASVRVNALGDRESRERFGRELGAFVRKRLGQPMEGLEEAERTQMLHEPESVYLSQSPVVLEILQEAPRPMHFLSERSRLHFKEVLDYLEQVGLQYELDDMLTGDEREPRITFRIDVGDKDNVVLGSRGGRFDDFVSRLSGRREQGAVHASIYFRKKGATRSSFGASEHVVPKMYFIQLGVRAKLRGLSVVDILRHTNVPIAQSFDASRLAPQLSAAQALGVPYVLIMGEREALDGTIIVRSMRNSSQEIVELTSLPKHLRALHI